MDYNSLVNNDGEVLMARCWRDFQKLILVFTSFVLVSLSFPSISAIGGPLEHDGAGVDLLLLVDASDSMRVLDEDRLADQIARSVLLYLVEDFPGDTTSRVGIFCFSDKMTPLLKLTPLSEVDLERVSVECERGGGTLFVKILEEVPGVFRAEPRPENRKVILLITDGHPSYMGESVLVEDEVNRNYLLGYVAPKISELQELDEKPTLHVIGVGETKFVDFWSHYNFTRVKDSDHLLRIGVLLAELFPVAPPPSPTLTPTFTPSPSLLPTFTPMPPTATSSPTSTPTHTATPFAVVTPTPTGTPSLSPSPIIPVILTSTPLPSLTETPTAVSPLSPTPTHGVVVQITPTIAAETPVPPSGEGWRDRDMIWAVIVLGLTLLAVAEGIIMVSRLLQRDLVKRARRLLQEARRYEERGDKKSADDAYNKVLVLVREHEEHALYISAEESRKAWLGKIQLWEGAAEQREVIFKGASTGTRGQLMGLADALKVRWAQQPEIVLEEIYGLLGSRCQPALFEFLAQPGVPPEVEDKAEIVHWVEEVCRSIRVSVTVEKDDGVLHGIVSRRGKSSADVAATP